MSNKLTKLTHLCLQPSERDGGFSGESVMLLFVQHCPQLQYLNLCEEEKDHISKPASGSGDNEDDDVLQRPAEPKLRTIDITGPDSHLQNLFVSSLSEKGLLSVLAQCKHLHTLGIYRDSVQRRVKKDSAEQALHHLVGTSVRTLHLQTGAPLRGVDLICLSGLEELCVANSRLSITSAEVVAIASQCPALHTLCIVAAPGLKRQCVVPILQNCSHLKSLELFVEGGHMNVKLVQQAKDSHPLLERVVLQLN